MRLQIVYLSLNGVAGSRCCCIDCVFWAGIDARHHAFEGISPPAGDRRIINIQGIPNAQITELWKFFQVYLPNAQPGE